MPTKPIPDRILHKTIADYKKAGYQNRTAARNTNVADNTFSNRLAHALVKFGDQYGMSPEDHCPPNMLERIGYKGLSRPMKKDKNEAAFEMPRLPSGRRPIAEILAARKSATRARIQASAARELIRVPVKQRGPVGLVLIGDPHVDDDGCDLDALDRDLSIIAANEAMHAVHVGDVSNGWCGRLAKLWAHQSSSAEDAKALAQWMFEKAPPLIVVQGNHDVWDGPVNGLIDHLMANHNALSGKHGVRVAFAFPNGLEYRMHVRHHFPGKSQYSDTHGMKRETLFGYRDHLLACGHLHVDEMRMVPINTDGIVSTHVIVSGYKVADDFAEGNRFISKRFGPACMALIDPDARIPAETTKLYWDLEEGADILKHKRRRAGA